MSIKDIHNFINGEFVATERFFDKRTPVDNSLIARVHEAGKAEVDAAVAAAAELPAAGTVLVKGSRGIGLEALVRALRAAREEPA